MLGQVRQTRRMVTQHTENGPFETIFPEKTHRDQSHSGLLLTITFKDSKPDLSSPAVCLEGLHLLHFVIRRSPILMACLIRSWDSTAASTNGKPWFSALFHHFSEGSTRLSLDVIMEGICQCFYYRFFVLVSGQVSW